MAMLVTTVFQEYGWKVLNHPLYTLDLSSLDYDLFPKLKEPISRICFNDLSEQFLTETQGIWWLSKTQLLRGIESLPESYVSAKCITLKGYKVIFR